MHELEASCFSLPWNYEQCQTALKQNKFAAFGLFKQDWLFAYISFYHIVDEMEIVNVAVAANLRRKGYGRLLLTTALQVGKKMSMQKVALEVRRGNLAAIHLYESLGFVLQGVRKHYYTDTGEDALIYQKLI
ncbi:MAG: ribosomal protein S18-alanine N-acetyltransferase [Desulfovibrionaceae bacterium]|nr:ribosomal protein S18-alanine N-acetyltransferase [Desulfovibrionaceae bacterium]